VYKLYIVYKKYSNQKQNKISQTIIASIWKSHFARYRKLAISKTC